MALAVKQETFASLGPQWDALFQRSSVQKVFLTPQWQQLCWDFREPGASLHLLTVRDGDGLLAIAPLKLVGETLTFLGDPNTTDYGDFLVCKDAPLEQVYHCLFEAVNALGWRTLDLWGLQEVSPTLARMKEMTRAAGWSVSVRQEEVVPYLELPDSWEGYLEGMDKKQRHELRRKIRRLSEAGQVMFSHVSDAAGLETALEVLMGLMAASREDKASFLNERHTAFFRALAPVMFSAGYLKLFFLMLDGRRVAGVLCFDSGGQYQLYNSGYDPAYAPLSVGLLSKVFCLQDAISSGRRVFDFMRGGEVYKYRLGAKNASVNRLEVTR